MDEKLVSIVNDQLNLTSDEVINFAQDNFPFYKGEFNPTKMLSDQEKKDKSDKTKEIDDYRNLL